MGVFRLAGLSVLQLVSLVLMVLFCVKCNRMTIVRFDDAVISNLSGANGQKTQAAREIEPKK